MSWLRSTDPAHLHKVRVSLHEAVARTRRLQGETEAVLAKARATSAHLERSRRASMETFEAVPGEAGNEGARRPD
jgi:hypothetical protein